MEVNRDTWCWPEKVYPDRNQNQNLGETPPCRWISVLQKSRRKRSHLELQNKQSLFALLFHWDNITVYSAAINQKKKTNQKQQTYLKQNCCYFEQSGFTEYFCSFTSQPVSLWMSCSVGTRTIYLVLSYKVQVSEALLPQRLKMCKSCCIQLQSISRTADVPGKCTHQNLARFCKGF